MTHLVDAEDEESPQRYFGRTNTKKNLNSKFFISFFGICALIGFAFAVLRLKTTLNDSSDHSDANLPSAEKLLSTRRGNVKLTKRAVDSPLQLATQLKRDDDRKGDDDDSSHHGVCLTKGCVKAAANMIEMMDTKVDPCDDFYAFSCGAFIDNNIIPDKKTSLSQVSLLADELNVKLRLALQEAPLPTDSHSVKLAKSVYAACMNIGRSESDGLGPVKEILNQLGGWPVLEGPKWDERNFDWIQFQNMSRQLGLTHNSIISYGVHPDLTNSTFRTMWFDQPRLGLQREIFMKGENDSKVQAYLKYSIEVAILFGADPLEAETQMKDALRFEIKLANISASKESRRNFTQLNNMMTIAKLSSLSPDVHWLKYINMLLPSHLSVDENEEVRVTDLNYTLSFTKVIKEAPSRTVANYLAWRAIFSIAIHLTESVRDAQLNFLKELSGIQVREPRWEECVKFTSQKIPFALGNIYIKKYFDNDAKNKSDELFSYLDKEFKKILSKVDWMDPETKAAALHKASVMKAHIAYPPGLASDDIVDHFHKNLSLMDSSYLQDSLRIYSFTTNFEFGQLREAVNKSDWKNNGRVAIVNAFYSPQENAIKFPAGILQGIFFDQTRPRYMNFAAIGNVIGHEITHGFDDRGSQFNEDGNLYNWWGPKTQKIFKEKTNCIIWQYGNYTVPSIGITLNGISTQGENIADNGAIKETYRAYSQWKKDNGEEPSLPGLSEYSPEQLFWISFAQTYCGKYRNDYLLLLVLTGFHSPNKYRVIGTLSNRQEFAKDWKCLKGSPMNPVKKCQVW